MRRIALLACLLALAAAAQAGASDWLRFGVDAARTGAFGGATGITRANLGELTLQRVTLPGTVDSSPLYLSGVVVAGSKRDVFVVTTTYGRALAIDADTGVALWQFVPPGIAGWEGRHQYTTATPVADPEHRFVYSPAPDGLIHKLALVDGHELRGAHWPARVSRMPRSEKLSSSLNLAGGLVLVTTASFEDQGSYQGHVVAIDRGSGRIRGVFNVVCARRRHVMRRGECKHTTGGIWGRGGAVVEPGTRRLLVATGNAPLNGRDAWGNSLLELSPNARTLRRVWSPRDYRRRQVTDGDFGSGSPTLLRYRGRLIAFQPSKDGSARILDVRRMRRHGRLARMPGLLDTVRVKPRLPFVGAAAVWRARNTFFLSNATATFAYRVKGRRPRLHRVWRRKLPGTSPVLAGGLLYVYDFRHGRLAMLDPANGRTLASRAAAAGHWNSPVVADGRVALGSGSGLEHATTGTLFIWRVPQSPACGKAGAPSDCG